MGNTQSQVPKEGQGHPEQFYRGVAAAKCARFTVSEVYFVQALQRHPGRAFWEQLMQGVNRAASSEQGATADRCEEGDEQDNDAHDSAWAELQTVRGQRHRQRTYTDADDHVTNVAELRGCKSVCSTLAGRRCHAAVSANGSTTKSTAASAKRSTATAAHLYNVKAVDVHLPLNGELLPILDYYRLMADIALTYVELLRTTRHPEKVSGFAARYCLFGITHTQALLHCLTLWKEETFGDGLGFVDYEGRRQHSAMSAVEEHQGADEYEDAKQQGAGAKTTRRQLSRTAARNFTLALAEAHCRYYHVSLLLSYSAVLARSLAVTTDGKRKQLIYANLLNHLDAVFRVTWEVAEEYPHDYIGQLIMDLVPSPLDGGYEPAESNMGSSCVSTLQSLSLSGDTQRHICMIGGGWSPLQSGLLPLSFARNARLRVHEAAFRRTEARLVSPAQRMSYHYITWAMDFVLLAVPGCSPYMLQRALPGFVPGKGTLSHQTEMVPQAIVPGNALGSPMVPSAPGAVSLTDAAKESPGSPDLAPEAVPVAPVVSKAKRAALLAKHEKELKRSGRNMNTDLDLSDERTLVMLCQDEVAILSFSALSLLLELRVGSGDKNGSAACAAAAMRMVSGLHGPESAEMKMAQLLFQTGADS